MFAHEDQSQQPATIQPTSGVLPTDTVVPTAPAINVNDILADPTTDTTSITAVPTNIAVPEPTIPESQGAGVPKTDQLLAIKQHALEQLTPLVGHLDQDPEEKFRTTMMMIQAADNDTLIQTAYEAALQITDQKARAQALLDIVNEINYFTRANNG